MPIIRFLREGTEFDIDLDFEEKSGGTDPVPSNPHINKY